MREREREWSRKNLKREKLNPKGGKRKEIRNEEEKKNSSRGWNPFDFLLLEVIIVLDLPNDFWRLSSKLVLEKKNGSENSHEMQSHFKWLSKKGREINRPEKRCVSSVSSIDEWSSSSLKSRVDDRECFYVANSFWEMGSRKREGVGTKDGHHHFRTGREEINQDQRLHWTSSRVMIGVIHHQFISWHEMRGDWTMATKEGERERLLYKEDKSRKREEPETGLIRKQDELAGDTKR